MTIDSTRTDRCSRKSANACPIDLAEVPPTDAFYEDQGYCKACFQIRGQLRSRSIDWHSNVGNVSRPVFDRGMREVRALQFRAIPPFSKSRRYLPLINEVIDAAEKPDANDNSFEAEIEDILARFPPSTNTNTTQGDEEQDGEEQDVEDQDDEEKDDAQSADEQGAAPVIPPGVLEEMREISDRMLALIARMDGLSVA